MKLNRDKPLGFSIFGLSKDYGDDVYESLGWHSEEAPGASDIYKDCIDEGFEILPRPRAVIHFDDYDYDNTNEGLPFLSKVEDSWIFIHPKRWVRHWFKEHPNQEDVVEVNGRLWKYIDTEEAIICVSKWNFE